MERISSVLLRAVLAVLVVTIVIVGLYYFYTHQEVRQIESLKQNMDTLHSALLEFALATGGYYPARLDIPIKEVARSIGLNVKDPRSVTGGKDPATAADIHESKGFCLLPSDFANPFNANEIAVMTFRGTSDYPHTPGVVLYIPLEVKRNYTTAFKIIGIGPQGPIDYVIEERAILRRPPERI